MAASDMASLLVHPSVWCVLILIVGTLHSASSSRVILHQSSSQDHQTPSRNCDTVLPKCPTHFECCFITPADLLINCHHTENINALNRFLLEMPRNISNVTITRCELRTVPSVVQLFPNLTGLFLSFNSVKVLQKDSFSNMTLLKSLDLKGNDLEELEVGCFNGLTNLNNLCLRSNSLSTIDPQVFLGSNLTSLLSIDLSYCFLTFIDTWVIALPQLKSGRKVTIDMRYNKIMKLTNALNLTIYDVENSYSLYWILSNNYISHARDINIIKLLNVTDVIELLRLWNMGFDIRNNPWDCGCDMYELVTFVEPIIYLFNRTLHDLDLIQLFCSTPKYNKGKLIYKMPLSDFRCHVEQNCPGSEWTCLKIPANNTIVMTCESCYVTALPRKVPAMDQIVMMLPKHNIAHLASRDFMENLTYLDLSQNGLYEIDNQSLTRMSSRVQLLDLSNNNLTGIPEVWWNLTWANLTTLRLDGNPFNCSCDLYNMKLWLEKQSKRLVNSAGILCSDQQNKGAPLIHLTYQEMCGKPKFILTSWMMIGIASGAIIIVAIIILITTPCLRKCIQKASFRSQMKSKISSHANTAKTYDAFLVYAEDSSSWVATTVQPILEVEAKMPVCLHERDFMPGRLISDNIISSLSSSKSVLVILSARMMQSSWCSFELDMADACQKVIGASGMPVVCIKPPDVDVCMDEAYKRLRIFLKPQEILDGSRDDFKEELVRVMTTVTMEREAEGDADGQSEHSRLSP